MPIIRADEIETEQFSGGASYRTLVGDDSGSIPLRVGVQTSPPGYDTGIHAHPYFEIVTVLSGSGEAWIDGEGGTVPIGAGTTMVFPPNVKHSFRTTGEVDLVTYGVHDSPERIVRR
jgi:mannose-6-phosphate isomerase-like protein (cupin superfamily)